MGFFSEMGKALGGDKQGVRDDINRKYQVEVEMYRQGHRNAEDLKRAGQWRDRRLNEIGGDGGLVDPTSNPFYTSRGF